MVVHHVPCIDHEGQDNADEANESDEVWREPHGQPVGDPFPCRVVEHVKQRGATAVVLVVLQAVKGTFGEVGSHNAAMTAVIIRIETAESESCKKQA